MRFFWTITSLLIALVAGGLYVVQPLPGSKARDAVGVRQTVERDGRTIVYFTQGAGPRVALAASAGREASDFNELSNALVAAGFRTVAVEAPGIGGTDLPRKPFDLYDLANDVNAVLKGGSGDCWRGKDSPCRSCLRQPRHAGNCTAIPKRY